MNKSLTWSKSIPEKEVRNYLARLKSSEIYWCFVYWTAERDPEHALLIEKTGRRSYRLWLVISHSFANVTTVMNFKTIETNDKFNSMLESGKAPLKMKTVLGNFTSLKSVCNYATAWVEF